MTLAPEIIRSDHLPLLELRPGNETEVISAMRAPIGFETHFLGRSLLCGGPRCDGCKHRGKRWLGYLGVQAGGKPYCLELTAAAWQAAWGRLKFEKWDDSLGVQFTVRKVALRSPLRLEPTAVHPAEQDVRATARVLRTAARLYRLPLPMQEESPSAWDERVADARRGIIRAAVLSEIGPQALQSGA